MRLFADDSILYREIEQPEDHTILQKGTCWMLIHLADAL